MSNAQTQTRGLSAGDWIRLQRLRGAKTYTASLASNEDVAPTPVPQTPYTPSSLIKPVVGTSRIRRPASSWTDYVASQTTDFVTSASTGRNGNVLTCTKLCDCTSATLNTKMVKCTKCAVYIHKSIQ
jgi:hypothetical protein